ncbi:hypothetical protein Syun_024421 [Stephania yunnanensis]|uniref:Pentatricopeptide repeat-containing protein n=1 Tax=Stephania yunnanensis TaxID=152371 RepID=A0AAP0I4C4_9MAGN
MEEFDSCSQPQHLLLYIKVVELEGLPFIDVSSLQISFAIYCVTSSSNHELGFSSLSQNQSFLSIQLSTALVEKLLLRFEDDWRSALGIFNWATEQPGYEHTSDTFDMMVDILGKAKQIERMWLFLRETCYQNLISLKTMAKVMRRLAGAGRWEDAVKAFDDLGTFGLEKDTDSMNVLLDTLCKERKVELAREIFYKLKLHISPNAYTFNIFIHGWCNAKRIDEAHWTIQEMKGYGCSPCVISYSTIIRAYCQQSNFEKVFGLMREMEAQGCLPNVVTHTTVMHSLAKLGEFEEALKIYERMKSVGCRPDTMFYNSLIYILGRAGKLQQAVHVFETVMPMEGIKRDTSTYNNMITIFCGQLQEQNALNVLKGMEESGLCKPDLRTYDPLLKLRFKLGKIDNILDNLLDDMIDKHHLSFDISTYTLLVHGLCRANKCKRAYLIFEEMVRKDVMPRYRTCSLLLDEVKRNNMADAAERIEALMRKLKISKQ